jgi:hypothetical protein
LFFLSDNFMFGNSLFGCVPKHEQHDVTWSLVTVEGDVMLWRKTNASPDRTGTIAAEIAAVKAT